MEKPKYTRKGVVQAHRCRVFKDRLNGMWYVKCQSAGIYLHYAHQTWQSAFSAATLHAVSTQSIRKDE